MKARLVAGGDCQDKTVNDKLSSPITNRQPIIGVHDHCYRRNPEAEGRDC